MPGSPTVSLGEKVTLSASQCLLCKMKITLHHVPGCLCGAFETLDVKLINYGNYPGQCIFYLQLMLMEILSK